MWETTVQSTTIDVPKELVLDAMRSQPKAVIFDIDGTMVDNMALHAEAFAVFARRHGLPPLTTEDRARLDGRRNSEILPILFGREVPRDEWQAYEAEKEGLYRELSRGRLQPMPACLTSWRGWRRGPCQLRWRRRLRSPTSCIPCTSSP